MANQTRKPTKTTGGVAGFTEAAAAAPSRPTSTEQPFAPITYGLDDAARVSGLSRRTLYNLHAAGDLQFIKVGSRTLVRRSDLEAFLTGKAAS